MKDKFAVSMFGQKRLSREGGIEIVVKELCTRMARDGCQVTCYNRSGHHVSGAEYDNKIEYDGIRQKFVPTIERKGLAAVSSSFFAALYSAFGKYDVVHIHAEGPAFFAWLPKLFGKKVVVTIHGIDWQREKWKSGFGSKFIRQGEKNAVKYADEIIVLSKGVQDYFKNTYDRDTWFIPNGVNRPEIKKAELITKKFGLTENSYILFLGRLVPEKGIRYVSMLTVMSNATSVGYYSNSTKIVKAVANTLTGISAVLMPRFSYLFSEDNKSEIKKLSRQFLNVTFLISVPCCCGIILVADQIVEVLFGVEFLPAISTIRILSILIVLMPLSGGVFCQLLLTAGKEKSYLACVLIGTVVNAVLNYLLIPTFTQNGAAIASVVAEFTVSISMIVATRRTIKVNMCCRDVFSILTSAFVMSLTLVLCHKLFFGQAVWMRLLVEIVIAILVYFLCVFMLKNSAFSRIIRMIKK